MASKRLIRKRCHKNFCPANFIAVIQEVSWLEIFLCDDVNTAVQSLSNKITFILDNKAPILVRKKFAPWLSQATVDMRKERYQLQKEAAQSQNRDLWKKFKCFRNKVNNRLKYEEKVGKS